MTNSEQTSVLISGGNKGLGFEAARRPGKQGWTILLGSRDESRGRAATDKLTDGGANVVVVPLDVTSDESVTDAVRLVREHTDRLDVLINNAGVPGRGITPADATVGEIHSVYHTNVYGPIRITYAFLPLLQAADHPAGGDGVQGGGSFTVVTDPRAALLENPRARLQLVEGGAEHDHRPARPGATEDQIQYHHPRRNR
jgi:NAD(P)-dependent dehydrogenase (short-subunit alcohol dehydrogenase family)